MGSKTKFSAYEAMEAIGLMVNAVIKGSRAGEKIGIIKKEWTASQYHKVPKRATIGKLYKGDSTGGMTEIHANASVHPKSEIAEQIGNTPGLHPNNGN